MRIVLIYPPPWKLAHTGDDTVAPRDGAPPGMVPEKCLSGDIQHIPYGLLSLAAQAESSGHEVQVLNLFAFAWQDVERIIDRTGADLFGISCFTANRRGAVFLAELIRRLHPAARIAVGGPHATALPLEMLAHCSAIDTIIIGEGEATFLELASRAAANMPTKGIAGTAWCEGSLPVAGPPRARIADLDSLVQPARCFDDHILISARGCPWDCSFCASTGLWGRRVRAHSPAYVLDMLETLVRERGQKAIAIKDETFTVDRRRVLALCRGIRARGLDFVWSCDTRADVLDAELLTAMRMAGCRRISIGVESAAPEILARLQKNISPEAVYAATRLARRFGFQVRFYMIVGSPGETMATLEQSLRFVREARPTEVIFNPFTLLPGTREFALAVQRGAAGPERFFSDTFFELQPLAQAADDEARQLLSWIVQNGGLQVVGAYSARECRDIVKLFPELSGGYLDLADALLRAGDLDGAADAAQQALDYGYPLPGLCLNYLACIAARRGRVQEALSRLLAAKEHGYHQVVERNIAAARSWATAGGPQSGLPLELAADNSFEVTRLRRQPVLPGKLTVAGRTFQPLL